MCTFNGARFLPAQLASIEQQSHRNWQLIVSDDGSSDDTLAIIRHFAERTSRRVEMRSSPRRGPAANFLSLATDPTIAGQYFAFCDQDDIWHPDKLQRAVARLRAEPRRRPVVYGGRTRLVTEDGRPFGYAHHFRKAPSFANALVQSIAGANTMVFNRSAKRILERAGPVRVVSHDWWVYQLITGSGGICRYDSEPALDYRQHRQNRIGSNKGPFAQWRRLRMILSGRFARWNDINLAALRRCRHLLTEDARAQLDAFSIMCDGGTLGRLRAFWTSGIRRQTMIGNAALLLALIVRKA